MIRTTSGHLFELLDLSCDKVLLSSNVSGFFLTIVKYTIIL